MLTDIKNLQEKIDAKQFSSLFIEELGWDKPNAKSIQVHCDGDEFVVEPVSNYKGIQVWKCQALPSARVQREIDRHISNVSAERLVIFFNEENQNWRWPMAREASGKGVIRLVNHEYKTGVNNVALLQRLQSISVPLKGTPPTLVEMLQRLRRAFDADQITKSFYKEFASEHKLLVTEIDGLNLESDTEWYASLLLNRLMFIYFMQWKGFMDEDQNYLDNRLQAVQKIHGPNQFFGFFKGFLLPLFHSGLGSGKEPDASPEILKLIGKIPYVNGGIFSEHELETKYDIQVPDRTFTRIFEFFDRYQWHLDSRPSGNPNEINPDVLGYIFEQFINNKAQGAYYTKEDVTEYMSSNTVTLAFLEKFSNLSRVNIFKSLSDNPERYIWASVGHGHQLKDNYVQLGKKVVKFSDMERKAPPEVGLPGETWWETKERIEHFSTLKNDLKKGKVNSINDLITANLDVDVLANDVIDGIDSADDVLIAWEVLNDLRVIDPTCGSGAFLFAALNRLEVLYSAVIDAALSHQSTAKNEKLDSLLGAVQRHPNTNYFILKNAAQQNIFGVDLMKEATEIARLRLFLKLISAIDVFEDIEPLPDLEFNIKSGNLLIGATTADDMILAESTFDTLTQIEEAKAQVTHLADLWENFKHAQDEGPEKSQKAKKLLSSGIAVLRGTLDRLVFDGSSSKAKADGFEYWKEISTPFHWFVEFPNVFEKDGFDVVIGNPPYIAKTKVSYNLDGHQTSDATDIYAMCMERAMKVTSQDGLYSMIVMLNLGFGNKYESLRRILHERFPSRWISGYSNRPSMLFAGTEVRNTIFIGKQGERHLYSTGIRRWVTEFRSHLMPTTTYNVVTPEEDNALDWPFVHSHEIAKVLQPAWVTLESSTLKKGPSYELTDGVPSWDTSQGAMHPLFYMASARNWISVFNKVPPVIEADGKVVITSKLKVIWFRNKELRDLAFGLAASKWMFAWWAMRGDDFDVTQGDLNSFPVNLETIDEGLKKELLKASVALDKEMTSNLRFQKVTVSGGRLLQVGNWDLTSCRRELEELDLLWARALNAESKYEDLQFQYYSTVKTDKSDSGSESDNLEDSLSS